MNHEKDKKKKSKKGGPALGVTWSRHVSFPVWLTLLRFKSLVVPRHRSLFACCSTKGIGTVAVLAGHVLSLHLVMTQPYVSFLLSVGILVVLCFVVHCFHWIFYLVDGGHCLKFWLQVLLLCQSAIIKQANWYCFILCLFFCVICNWRE